MFDDQNQNPNAPKNLPAEPVDMFAGVETPTQGRGSDRSVGENIEPPASAPDALSAGLLRPAPLSGAGKKDEVKSMPNLPATNQGVTLQNYKMSTPILGKILFFLLIVLLLGGLGYGGWWLFYASKNQPVKLPVVPANQTGQNQTPQNSNVANTISTSTNIPAQQNNDQILFGQAVDSDKDGLDDVREKQIGTDPHNPDTDGDGLSDGDEVIVYKTNPLNPDTDGDGLSDGDEVLIWHTNPLNPDTDGDGYPDGTEVKNGYNPLGPGKLFSSPTTTPTTTI